MIDVHLIHLGVRGRRCVAGGMCCFNPRVCVFCLVQGGGLYFVTLPPCVCSSVPHHHYSIQDCVCVCCLFILGSCLCINMTLHPHSMLKDAGRLLTFNQLSCTFIKHHLIPHVILVVSWPHVVSILTWQYVNLKVTLQYINLTVCCQYITLTVCHCDIRLTWH